MLVLKRYAGKFNQDRIFLETSDGMIEIVLVASGSGSSKIGIQAPEGVVITRPDMKSKSRSLNRGRSVNPGHFAGDK